MPRAVALGVILLVLWLLLSGKFSGLLLALGALSCAAVAAICARMGVVDAEGHPPGLEWRRVPGYCVWLLREIAASNIDVVRRIVDPDMPIDPVLTRVPTSQATSLGRFIYANSITLTPGTVSIDLDDGGIHVHALTRAAADALADGEMDRRVRALERGE